MKKTIALLLAAALPLSLAACGGGNDAGEPAAQSPAAVSSAPAASAPEQTPAPAPAPEPAVETLALNTPYASDDIELTVNEVYMTKKCEVSTGSHSRTYQEASEGNTFLVLSTTMKNLRTETLDTWSTESLFRTHAMYNDKYRYEQSSIIVGENEIEPLAAKTECITMEIPGTIVNATEPLVVFLELGGKTYQHVVR